MTLEQRNNLHTFCMTAFGMDSAEVEAALLEAGHDPDKNEAISLDDAKKAVILYREIHGLAHYHTTR
jgi:hypothetical protein